MSAKSTVVSETISITSIRDPNKEPKVIPLTNNPLAFDPRLPRPAQSLPLDLPVPIGLRQDKRTSNQKAKDRKKVRRELTEKRVASGFEPTSSQPSRFESEGYHLAVEKSRDLQRKAVHLRRVFKSTGSNDRNIFEESLKLASEAHGALPSSHPEANNRSQFITKLFKGL